MDQDNSTQPQVPKTPQTVMDIQRPARSTSNMVAPAPQIVQSQPQAIPPNLEAQEVGAPSYDQQHVALNKQVKKKRRGIILLITFTIVITLGLIGAAGYAYWRSMSSDNVEQPAQTTTDTATDTTGVDATTAEIDETLNTLDDSADFNNDDLSDDGIGL